VIHLLLTILFGIVLVVGSDLARLEADFYRLGNPRVPRPHRLTPGIQLLLHNQLRWHRPYLDRVGAAERVNGPQFHPAR
jgi:hypothetical protein